MDTQELKKEQAEGQINPEKKSEEKKESERKSKLREKSMENGPGNIDLFAFLENGRPVIISKHLEEVDVAEIGEKYINPIETEEDQTIKAIEGDENMPVEEMGKVAHEQVEDTKGEVLEIDKIMALFRKHLDEIAIISSSLRDLELNVAIEAATKNLLLTKEAAADFRQLFEQIGYQIEPVSAPQGEAGYRVYNKEKTFDFIFIYGQEENPQPEQIQEDTELTADRKEEEAE